MEFHEAANLFPLDDEHIDELAADIRKNGQLVAIELLDGKILDGRRRFLACRKAGRTPETIDVSPDDPIAHVISLNLKRRQLSVGQIAMIGDKARALYDEQAKRRKQAAGRDHGRGRKVPVRVPEAISGDSRDLAGKAVGLGGTSMDRARKIREKGTPELLTAVEQDRISLTRAAEVADEDPETQRDLAAKAKKSGGRYRTAKRDEEELPEGTPRGVGMLRANEAINCLMRIPKNDRLRKRGFQAVKDWIRRNP